MVIVDESQPVGLGVVAHQAIGQAQREKGDPYLNEVHFLICSFSWFILCSNRKVIKDFMRF